jgi:hypothetical protein
MFTVPAQQAVRRQGEEFPSELLGLPGAGKSFAYDMAMVAGLTGRQQWSQDDLSGNRLMHSLRRLASRPGLHAALILCVLSSRGPWLAPLRRMLSVVRRVDLASRQDLRAEVLDEGPIHALFVMLYGVKMTWASTQLARIAARRAAQPLGSVVYIDLPAERCVANWTAATRGSLRFNANSGEEERRRFIDDDTYGVINSALASASASVHVVGDAMAAVQLLLGFKAHSSRG